MHEKRIFVCLTMNVEHCVKTMLLFNSKVKFDYLNLF